MMKRFLMWGWIIVIALAVGCSSEQPGTPSEEGPQPVEETYVIKEPVMLEEALVIATVGDVMALCDNVDTMLQGIVPGWNYEEVKNQLGMMLNDPDLKMLQPGIGAAFVVLEGPQIALFMEVPSEIQQQALQTFENSGMAAEETAGMLIAASNTEGIEAGKAVVTQVKNILLEHADVASLNITVNLRKVITLYDKDVQQWFQSMKMMIGMAGGIMAQQEGAQPSPEQMQSSIRILEAEFHIFYSLAKQVEVLNLQISPGEQGLLMYKTVVPVKDSHLENFLEAETAAFPADLVRMLPMKGAMRGGYSLQYDAMIQLVEEEANALVQEINLKQDTIDEVIETMRNWKSAYGDRMAIDMCYPDSPILSGWTIMEVYDPEETIIAFETLEDWFASSGITDLYKTFGMTVDTKFTKNVREYQDIPIHELGFNQEFEALSDAQWEQMKAFMGEMKYEVAFVDTILVYAMGSSSIEDAIDAVKAGVHPEHTSLFSRRIFKPGGQLYIDYDMGTFMGEIFGKMALFGGIGEEMTNVWKSLKGADPLALVVYIQGGNLKGGMLIPRSLIEKFGQAAQNVSSSERGEKFDAYTCQKNLGIIDGAKEQWALEHNQKDGAIVTWDDLVKPGKTGYLQEKPVCPKGGTYTLNPIGQNPTCSYEALPGEEAHTMW